MYYNIKGENFINKQNNSHNVYVTLGASNHTKEIREKNDYYATDPIAIDILLNETNVRFNNNIWECACGEGHLSERLKQHGYNVFSTDIIERNVPIDKEVNFLKLNDGTTWNGDIITNPPYSSATSFIKKAMDVIPTGNKVAMLLKVLFLEGKARKELFKKYPPKYVYVFSGRIMCAKNAEFDKMKAGGGSAVAYAWFIWEKGYQGKTIIDWIN